MVTFQFQGGGEDGGKLLCYKSEDLVLGENGNFSIGGGGGGGLVTANLFKPIILIVATFHFPGGEVDLNLVLTFGTGPVYLASQQFSEETN